MPSTLPLPFLVGFLIVWVIPNIFFGVKVGGGKKLQVYNKFNGQYVDSVVAFIGSLAWSLFVACVIYPVIATGVENYFASLDERLHPIAALIIFAIIIAVFAKRKWY